MVLNNLSAILRMLADKHVTLEGVTHLKHEDLKPELWKPIYDKIKQRDISTMIADTEERFDGLLQCECCKSWKTRYVERQTRSADEPLTVFATCLDCNTNWRF